MKIFGFLLATLLMAMTAPSLQGIYGKDDRQEIYEVNDPEIRRLADSTMAMFSHEWLERRGNSYHLNIQTLGEYYNLCSRERFWNQPVSADCSAALVGPDLVLTAGHCVTDSDCTSKYFAFGYQYKNAEDNIAKLPASDVYSCQRVIYRVNEGDLDFAIIQLDRETNRQPLRLASRNARVGSSVFMLGFPLGLPLKYSGHSRVRKQSDNFFMADLDTFSGNSGSPVFSSSTKEIVGVLVRGYDDFARSKNSCNKINHCKNCDGEDVTNILPISQYLIQAK
jgi:hypothetical protein